jgi:hypothetical protein
MDLTSFKWLGGKPGAQNDGIRETVYERINSIECYTMQRHLESTNARKKVKLMYKCAFWHPSAISGPVSSANYLRRPLKNKDVQPFFHLSNSSWPLQLLSEVDAAPGHHLPPPLSLLLLSLSITVNAGDWETGKHRELATTVGKDDLLVANRRVFYPRRLLDIICDA